MDTSDPDRVGTKILAIKEHYGVSILQAADLYFNGAELDAPGANGDRGPEARQDGPGEAASA